MPSMDSSSSEAELQPQHNLDRNDDFLDQMLSSISAWPELPQVSTKFPWDGGSGEPMGVPRAGETGLMPLSLRAADAADLAARDGIVGGNSNGVAFGLPHRSAGNHQLFPATHQNFAGPSPASTSATSSGATSGGAALPRQKVRARRGQATDPHSIAERLRRERIAERMKALQELVPNANKTDKASMLDEIIEYVKFLQLQVKVLSMSRLGGAAAVAPLMANMTSERITRNGAKEATTLQAAAVVAGGGGGNGLGMTEQQVAKLMEEDMGSAMQYLQGKGLCLMPISLASAISTVTGAQARSPATASRAHLAAASGSPFLHGGQQQSSPGSNGGGSASLVVDAAASTLSKEGSSTSMSD